MRMLTDTEEPKKHCNKGPLLVMKRRIGLSHHNRTGERTLENAKAQVTLGSGSQACGANPGAYKL